MSNNADTKIREIHISVDEWIKMYESGFYAVARVVPSGNSMWPLICSHKDVIEVRPVDREPEEGDIVVFRREDGKAVVHRVYKKEDDLIQTFGDNCEKPDMPVRAEQVIGIVTQIRKGPFTIPADSTNGLSKGIRMSNSCIRKIKNIIKK